MRNYKNIFIKVKTVTATLVLLFAIATPVVISQSVIASVNQPIIVSWDFEDQDSAADDGIAVNFPTPIRNIQVNDGAILTGYSTDYSAGKAIASNNWANPVIGAEQNWSIEFGTTGYESITMSSRQRSSITGPHSFFIQYRVGVGPWTNLSSISLAGADWASINDIALPAECKNQSSVSVRWVTTDYSVANNAGTNRIDDIVVRGTKSVDIPSTPDLLISSDSGISDSDDLTNITFPTFDITGIEIGNSYDVYMDGTKVATGQTNPTWTSTELSEGTHQISVTAVNGDDLESAKSLALDFTIDTTAPDAPDALDMQAARDSGISDIDNITNLNPIFDVSGVAETYYRVYICYTDDCLQKGDPYGTNSYHSDPSWFISQFGEGSHRMVVVNLDKAGNESLLSDYLDWTLITGIPVITINGTTPVFVEYGTPYIDEGATALSSLNQDISNLIIVDNPVNTDTLANYIVSYDVTDWAGNQALRVLREVNVIDTTAPIILIDPYVTEPTNQNITVTATTNEGILNISSHTFSFNGSFDFIATDASNNIAKLTVVITNIDKTAPLVLLNGGDVNLQVGDTYNELGATADDGSIVVIGGSVDTTKVGTYLIYYNATDLAGNLATTAIRTVTVKEVSESSTLSTSTQPVKLAAQSNQLSNLTDESAKNGDKSNTSSITQVKSATTGKSVLSNWWIWLIIIVAVVGALWYLSEHKKLSKE